MSITTIASSKSREAGEFIVGCQCSSAWQGCGSENQRNEVNGNKCQVYGNNVWADVMCAQEM